MKDLLIVSIFAAMLVCAGAASAQSNGNAPAHSEKENSNHSAKFTDTGTFIRDSFVDDCVNDNHEAIFDKEHFVSVPKDAIEEQEYEWLRLHDPKTGTIPFGIKSRELAFASHLPSKEAIDDETSDMTKKQSRETQSSTWNSNGPYNVGGRTRALAISADGNYLIAGGVSGGMWRSLDFGSTWAKTTPDNVIQSVTCVAQDIRSGKQNTWYYGTGEFAGNSGNVPNAPHVADYYGNGIFKSTDAGITWVILPATTVGEHKTVDSSFQYVFNIVTDPSDTTEDVVYAAVMGGIERSTDGGNTWNMVLGTFKNSHFTDVAITSSGVIYAALSTAGNYVQTAPTNGIFRSTDGIHWTNIIPAGWPVFTDQINIGIAPSNENVVYFIMDTGTVHPNNFGINAFWKYTFQSGDGSGTGGTWSNRTANLPNNKNINALDFEYVSQTEYDMYVRVSPGDENVVFIGGVYLYVSPDGLATYSAQAVSYNLESLPPQHNDLIHVDQHALVFAPGDPTTLFVGNDGGVYSGIFDNLSNTVSWSTMDNGYYTTQYYTVALDHGTPGNNVVIGGMQDNGTYFTNSSNETTPWSSILGGDGSFCSIVDGRSTYYVSYQDAVIYRLFVSDLGNADYSTASEVDPQHAIGAQFINPFVLDPSNQHIMYLAEGDSASKGKSGIWRNSDLSQIPNGVQQQTSINWEFNPNTVPSSGFVSALGICTTPPNRLYYGTSVGNVFRLDGANSGNPVPIDITNTISSVSPNGFISCIAVDPQNGDNAVVVFSNYSIQSLFYTSDAGASWTAIGGNLEQVSDGSGEGPSCRWASILHVGNGIVYLVGTEVGLYSTSYLNGASTVWEQEGASSIGYTILDMIDARTSDDFVAAATHGAGVFTSTYSSSAIPQAPETPELSFPVNLATNLPTNPQFQWTEPGTTSGIYFQVQISTDPTFTNSNDIINSTLLSASQYNVTGLKTNTTYYWRVIADGSGGESSYSQPWQFTTGSSAVNEQNASGLSFALYPNFPNPFASTTQFNYQIETPGLTTLKIYNILGEEITTLFSGQETPGFYSAKWNAGDAIPGVYTCKLTSGTSVSTRQTVLVK